MISPAAAIDRAQRSMMPSVTSSWKASPQRTNCGAEDSFHLTGRVGQKRAILADDVAQKILVFISHALEAGLHPGHQEAILGRYGNARMAQAR